MKIDISNFKSWLKDQSLSKNSIKNYTADVEKFLSWHKQTSQENLNSPVFETFRQTLLQEKTPMATANRLLSSLRRFGKYLQKKGLTPQNPTLNLKNLTADELQTPPSKTLFDQFENALLKEKLSPATIKNYLSDVQQFFLWLEGYQSGVDLQQLNANLVGKYKEYLKSDLSLAATSIDRKVSSLKRFFSWLQNEGLIPSDPFAVQKKIPEKPTTPLVPTHLPITPGQLPQEKAPLKKLTREDILEIAKRRWPFLAAGAGVFLLLLLILTKPWQHLFPEMELQEPTATTERKMAISPSPEPDITVTPAAAGYSPWIIKFSGKLTTKTGEQINETADIFFSIYNKDKGGSPLWVSKEWPLAPDSEGNFSAPLGDTTRGDKEIPSRLFFVNEELFLAISVAGEELGPRQRISTAANSANAYLLQDYQPQLEASASAIPVLDETGALTLAAQAPKIKALNDTFALEGEAITITTPFASNGDISLAPDGEGTVRLYASNQSGKSLAVTNANLITGSLIDAQLSSDILTPYLITLKAGATPKTKFSVDSAGNLYLTGTITGADELTLADSRTQAPLSDASNTTLPGGATSIFEALNLAYSGTSGNTATSSGIWTDGGDYVYPATYEDVRIYDSGGTDYINISHSGTSAEISALNTTDLGFKVPVIFKEKVTMENATTLNDQIRLDNLSSAPTAMGEGALYYNTSDDSVYYYTAAGWQNLLGLWTDGGTTTYLTSNSDDLAFGGTGNTAPFFLDVSANMLRLGSGSTTNASFNMYASDNDSGSITYTTDDRWEFSGGSLYSQEVTYLGDTDSYFDTSGNLILPASDFIQFDSSDTKIYANTDDPEDLVLEADQDILLSPDSNVGIGTASPNALLHLADDRTTGELLEIDWTTSTTQTAALTGALLDFTNLTSVAGSTTYGLHINDLSAQTTSTEYAIYQQGANWDYGAYFEDDVYLAAGETIAGALTLAGNVDMVLDSGGATPIDIGADVFSSGTLIDVAYDTAETLTSDLVGLSLNLNTNVTGVADGDLTAIQLQTPALTSSGATTTNYYGTYLSTSGVLDTTDNADVTNVNWYGSYIQMPDIDTGNAADTTTSYGLYIAGGTATDGAGTENQYGLIVDSNAGNVGIGDTTPTEAQLVLSSDLYVGSFASSGTAALCWDNDGGSLINDCSGNPVADYTEIYPTKEDVEYGEIVALGNETVKTKHFQTDGKGNPLPTKIQSIPKLEKANKPYQNTILGITSSNWSDFSSTGHGTVSQKDSPAPIALSGRVLVKVSNRNGAIMVGDPITSSAIPGVGMKANQAGPIVGKALQSYDSSQVGKILVFVNLGWHDPDIYLTDTGSLQIKKIENSYELGDASSGKIVERISALKELAAANIKAGLGKFEELSVNKKLVSPAVKTDFISPVSNDSSGLSVALTEGQGLSILNLSGLRRDTVAAIDSSGKGTFRELVTQKLDTQTLDARRLNADEVNTATVSARIAKLEKVYAEEIVASKVKILNDFFPPNPPESSSSADKTDPPDYSDLEQELDTLLAELKTPNISTASSSWATTAGDIENLNIANNLLITSNSISVLGQETLYLQPSGLGQINLLAGAMTIDESGDVQISGSLYVAGKTDTNDLKVQNTATVSGSLFANLIKPLDKNLTVELTSTATGSGIPDSKFQILNSGHEVASIDASGSARFKKLLIASAEATPSANTFGQIVEPQITTNATAGQAVLPAGAEQITIKNQHLTPESLVYITPQSDTQNEVLYVKKKVPSSQSPAASYFTVAINKPISKDILFNWWLIN